MIQAREIYENPLNAVSFRTDPRSLVGLSVISIVHNKKPLIVHSLRSIIWIVMAGIVVV